MAPKPRKQAARRIKPDQPVNVGIIGTGFGVRTQLPVFTSRKDAKVLMLCGRNRDKTAKIASEWGVPYHTDDYRDVCRAPEIDLVCIAVPPNLHREIAVFAVSSGKHVICEKPLALDSGDAIEIVEAVSRRRRRLYLVDQQLRFQQEFCTVRKLLHSGKIGQPYLVRIDQSSQDFFKGESDWKWWFQQDTGGGLLLAMGPHLIDLLYHWFGQCRRVDAHTEILPGYKSWDGEERPIEVEAAFSATLTMESGVTALISATAVGCSPKKTLRISILGTTGEIHFDETTGVTLTERGRHPQVLPRGSRSESTKELSIFRSAFEDFVDCLIPAVQQGRVAVTNAATFRDGLEVLIILDAIRLSSRTQQAVDVPHAAFIKKHVRPKPRQLSFRFLWPHKPETAYERREGFHISRQHQRAMVSLGPYSRRRPCPYSCAFCYVPAGFSRYPCLQPDQIAAELASRRHNEPFDRVYVSGDTDSFSPGRDGVGLLESLTSLNLDLLFTTRSISLILVVS